jgi:hypothetical protein
MGSTFYSSSARSVRADSAGYYTKSVDDVFEQNKVRRIHESMEPKKALLREARDSDNHPLSVPIVVALDVTGSMSRIPHHLIKDGLPTIMDGIMESGIKDPQILFLAIGDAKRDSYPLQVGQFESGDEELDTWLTRTYLEGGGGGNGGESYSLAWYFAAKHTVTDAWEKRKQKGFIFTIGDEPSHNNLAKNEIDGLMEGAEKGYTNKELLDLASEKYHVYHLHVMEGSDGHNSLKFWQNLMGERCIRIDNYADIPKKIAEIVSTVGLSSYVDSTTNDTTASGDDKVRILI